MCTVNVKIFLGIYKIIAGESKLPVNMLREAILG